jgi:NAD(P)H-dependent FMN reductase
MKILAVTGSLQAKSSNKSLVELAGRIAPPGVEWIAAPSLGALPHYNADMDGEDPPESVRRWRDALNAADAVFFASPEYGHGMPGSLKNALDWVVGTGNFFRKPVVATCAGAGPDRGAMGLAMLVQTLRAIDAVIVWNAPLVVPRKSIHPDGTISDATVEAALHEVFAALEAAIQTTPQGD